MLVTWIVLFSFFFGTLLLVCVCVESTDGAATGGQRQQPCPVHLAAEEEEEGKHNPTRHFTFKYFFFCYFENMNLINKWMENKIVWLNWTLSSSRLTWTVCDIDVSAWALVYWCSRAACAEFGLLDRCCCCTSYDTGCEEWEEEEKQWQGAAAYWMMSSCSAGAALPNGKWDQSKATAGGGGLNCATCLGRATFSFLQYLVPCCCWLLDENRSDGMFFYCYRVA